MQCWKLFSAVRQNVMLKAVTLRLNGQVINLKEEVMVTPFVAWFKRRFTAQKLGVPQKAESVPFHQKQKTETLKRNPEYSDNRNTSVSWEQWLQVKWCLKRKFHKPASYRGISHMVVGVLMKHDTERRNVVVTCLSSKLDHTSQYRCRIDSQ